MKNHFVFEHTFFESDSKTLSTIIYQLKSHPEFRDNLTRFWKLFSLNLESKIARTDLEKYYANILHLFLPIYSKSEIQERARIDVQRLTQNNSDSVDYSQFCEFFAKLSFLWLEDSSANAAIYFLNLIYNRTTRHVVIHQGKHQAVNSYMKVTFFMTSQLAESIPASRLKKIAKTEFFFDETLIEDMQSIEKASKDPEKTVLLQIIPYEDIIPCGFSAENVFVSLANQETELKPKDENEDYPPFGSSEKLRKFQHIEGRSSPNANYVHLWAEGIPNILKEYNLKVERHFIMYPVIFDSAKSSNIIVNFRLNDALAKIISLEKLKNKGGAEAIYNAKSDLYFFEEYKIDLIHKIRAKNEYEKGLNSYYDEDDSDPHKYDKHLLTFGDMYMKVITQKLAYFELDREFEIRRRAMKEEMDIFANKDLFRDYKSHFEALPQDPNDSFTEDIIQYANQEPIYILAIGKPKCGTSTLCKSLADKMGIERVSVEKAIEDLLNKVKEDQENPQQDADGNPVDIFSPLEKGVLKDLQDGKSLTIQQQIDLLNTYFTRESVAFKGYIFDFPIYENESFECRWHERLINGEFLLPGGGRFSHVVYLDCTDNELRFIGKDIMEDPEEFKLTSLFDREIVKKPKPKRVVDPDDEDDQPEEEENDEDKPPPPNEKNLVHRANESTGILQGANEKFKAAYSYINEMIIKTLAPSRFVKIEVSGLSPAEVFNVALSKFKDIIDPLRPIAKKMDEVGDDDFKSLLRQNLEGGPSRRWSPWGYIDPVALSQGRVVPGKGEFPCEYADRVFVFSEAINRDKFIDNPKRYLKDLPQMPETYNISIIGPPGSGTMDVAKKLNERYGWKIINVEDLVANKIREMRKWPQHIPNNPKTGSIHPSEDEYKALLKGGSLTGASIIPMILWELGLPLYKRPPKPVEPDPDNPDKPVDQPPAKDDKSMAKSASKKSTKKDESAKNSRANLDQPPPENPNEPEERPPTPPPEDFKLIELGVQPKEDGTVPPVTGFILVGFPQSADQVEALKDHNIKLDKVLYLVDTSDQVEENPEPGRILKTRADYVRRYNLEAELDKYKNLLQLLKDNYTEDVVKEISINYSPAEFHNLVLWSVDPFFINISRESDILAPADVEEDDPIRFADCGPYCAVTLANEGWLIPGAEEGELQVRGKRYRFFTEKEAQVFKNNVEKYVNLLNRKNLKVPPPRILMMGIRGSGLHTQMNLLNEQYKLSRIELCQEMLEILGREKARRRKDRELARGFRPPPPEGEDDPNAAELDDPEDFDFKKHETEVLNRILHNVDEIVINGNMFDAPEGAIQTGLLDLLKDARKLPEVFVYLVCKEEEVLKRIFDEKSVVDKHEQIVRKRIEDKDKRRVEKIAERRKEKQEAGEEVIDLTEDELAQIEQDIEDPENPTAPEATEEEKKTKIEEEKNKILEAVRAQADRLEEYAQAFEEAKIKVFKIESDRDIESVYAKVVYDLNKYLEKREFLFEQVYDLKEAQQPLYESRYAYKKSKFYNNCLDRPWELPRVSEYPVLYRSRIYYFRSKEEKEKAFEILPKLIQQPAIPRDRPLNIKIFVVGKIKTGKSTIAKLLEQRLGLVRIKLKHLLNRSIENPFWSGDNDVEDVMRAGQIINNLQIVDLLAKRIQLEDCQQRGFVLDGFPLNRDQAISLSDRGIIPDLVINMDLTRTEVMERALQDPKTKSRFGFDNRVLHQRLELNESETDKLLIYYLENFNNIMTLNPKFSKSGMFNKAKLVINEILERKYKLMVSLSTHTPCNISRLVLTQKDIITNISEYLNCSPVTLRTKGTFNFSNILSDTIYFFNNKIYFLASNSEGEDFIKNPANILKAGLSLELRNAPKRIDFHDCLEAHSKKMIELKGYCPVSLINGKLEKGLPDLLFFYDNKVFSFKGETEAQQFIFNPKKFEIAKLPSKMPLNEIQAADKSSIREKAKKGESTAYLEHHLGNIVIKTMAQLGNRRLKYPTLGYRETALKMMAISLKANNPNKDEAYRKKYAAKLAEFIRHCHYSEELRTQSEYRDEKKAYQDWQDWDEEEYLKRMEEFHDFMKVLKSEDKMEYFKQFIR